MLNECIKSRILEPCQRSYRNSWFLIKKMSEKYQIVNAAMNMNKITIRDVNLSLNCEDFTEDFVSMTVSSLLDFYADYDQMKLNEESRDMTAFQTSLELLRMTTIFMKVTNSVRQFVQAMQQILAKHISHDTSVYLNDVEVKNLKIKYNNEEVSSELKKYVLKH